MPKVAVEVTRGCRLTIEWDEMLARYVVSFVKFKSEEQLYFGAKVDTIHIERLQYRLSAIEQYIEDNNLNLSIKRSKFVTSEKESLLVYNR